jgi:hypothetical protein
VSLGYRGRRACDFSYFVPIYSFFFERGGDFIRKASQYIPKFQKGHWKVRKLQHKTAGIKLQMPHLSTPTVEDKNVGAEDEVFSKLERRSLNLVKLQQSMPRSHAQDASKSLKEHQQLQRRSSEKQEQSGTSTLRSKAARPEEASTIASRTDDLELQPTEGEQKHLHPNRSPEEKT